MSAIGIAVVLFIAGTWFARPLHRMRLLALADFYRRRYSVRTETLTVGLMLISNIVLVAGNLAGLGLLLQIVLALPYLPMLVAIAVCILAYAVSGGLHATIATSVLQVSIFIASIAVADAYRGLDTLLAPVVGLVAMVAVSLLTLTTHRPRHDELKRVPSERDLVAGLDGA